MKLQKEKGVKSKIALSLALIFLGFILLFVRPPKNVSSGSFENEPVKITGFDQQEIKPEDLPVRIVLPKENIDLPVSEAKIVNGFWEVFEDKAAWGEDSGVPGRAGNQVIFAHAREGLFLPLKGVKIGDSVYVFTKDMWYAYEVKEIKEVFPNQKEVIEPTLDETLTLYTCSGFNDSKRLIIVAKRI